jgi:hypothetical protein
LQCTDWIPRLQVDGSDDNLESFFLGGVKGDNSTVSVETAALPIGLKQLNKSQLRGFLAEMAALG